MALKFPQLDLPSLLRGGAVAWDSPAGEIVEAEYFESPPLAFPLSLPWTGYWRSSWSLPWTGEATAGLSLGRDLYEAADFPGSAAAQNGYTPPAFDGTNDLLTADGVAEDYFGTTGWTIHAVVKCNSLAAPGGFTADNEALLSVGPGSAAVNLAFDSDGVTALQYDGIGGTSETARIAVGTTDYRIIQARWTGTQIQCRVDGGAWQSTACTSQVAYSGTGETLRVGVNYDGTKFFDVDVLEIGTFDQSLSDSDLDALKSYAITRYSLGGVQTVTTVGFRGRGLYGASALTLSALLSSLGSKSRQIAGASTASVGAVTTTAQGARPRPVLGASAASIGALTVPSLGSRRPLVAGASAIALSAISLTSLGSRSVGRAGSSTVTLTLAAAAQGLVSRNVLGSSSVTIGAVSSSQLGLVPRNVFGPSLATSVFTIPAQGFVGRAQAGASSASVGAVTVPTRGVLGRLVAGASALSSIVQTSSFGLVSRSPVGASTASVSALTVVTTGSRPKDVRGASSPALGGVFVTSLGARSRDVFGASLASTGTVTQNVFTVGFRPRDVLGASAVTLTPIATQAQGLASKIVAGASQLSATIAVASKGARFPDRGGASVLSSSIVVPSLGRPDRTRAGSSTATIGAVVSPAAPAPGIRVQGASTLTLSPIVLASLGARPRQVAGVAAPVSLLTVPTFGSRAAERRGASTLSLSASTVPALGLVGRTQVGGLAGSLSAFNIGTFGFRARARNGASFVTVGSPYSDGELRSRISAATRIASVLEPRTSFVHATSARTTFSTEVEMELYVGADAKIETEVRVNGVLTDPTSLSCEVTAPDNSVRTYVYPTDITKVSTGVYRFFVDCTMAGTYKARWVSPGPGAKGADRLYFDVTA